MEKNFLINALTKLLLQGGKSTQETICKELNAQGLKVNQSQISRLLKKINAIKSQNEQGEMIYCLPHDLAPPIINAELSSLIVNIIHNETMIIIKTSPGSASLIARILDNKKCNILGTIAGDDTIFVVPESVEQIKKTLIQVCKFLRFQDFH